MRWDHTTSSCVIGHLQQQRTGHVGHTAMRIVAGQGDACQRPPVVSAGGNGGGEPSRRVGRLDLVRRSPAGLVGALYAIRTPAALTSTALPLGGAVPASGASTRPPRGPVRRCRRRAQAARPGRRERAGDDARPEADHADRPRSADQATRWPSSSISTPGFTAGLPHATMPLVMRRSSVRVRWAAPMGGSQLSS